MEARSKKVLSTFRHNAQHYTHTHIQSETATPKSFKGSIESDAAEQMDRDGHD